MADVFGDLEAVKSVSVMEGDSVTLNSDTELQTDDVIQWRFGSKNTLIASINKGTGSFSTSHGPDGRFRDRLKLDKMTGSLTITNITTTDSGLYQIRTKMIYRFSVTVYARLPVPVISSNSSQNPSSSSSCSLVCSVVNVSDVTLSWYKGNSLWSSINVSDLSISLSLPLDIECLDDSYSCVVAYSFTNLSTHLNNTQLCPTCSECVHCCGVAEAVIRLVISALVGVATVVVLVYDIRPRKEEQQRRSSSHTD
ncbi:SLAM family member 9-like [Garra rufa]|uniref:SLAM family member 9-like n=1 Tax=Garra rufa TaxID=137080 RepID=UPI003CCECFF0